jgi:hypothetical protein
MRPGAEAESASGAALFARFAYPPNALGLCGPEDHLSVLEHAASGVIDRGLVELARQFTGAWPYLELLAGAARLGDPLDARVVESYWIGSELLGRVALPDFGRSLDERFRRRLGPAWDRLAELLPVGAGPHHNFHVFGVYPWVGLLRSGEAAEPLRILDRCRIRWGRVLAPLGRDGLLVRARPLVWDGQALRLGPPRAEAVRRGGGGVLLPEVQPGDWVALHWDWLCQPLTGRQLTSLRTVTHHQLAAVNGAAHPGAAALLG